MQKPVFKVIRVGDDVITSSPGNVCNPDCIPVTQECTPICVGNDPGVCDCVEGDT